MLAIMTSTEYGVFLIRTTKKYSITKRLRRDAVKTKILKNKTSEKNIKLKLFCLLTKAMNTFFSIEHVFLPFFFYINLMFFCKNNEN